MKKSILIIGPQASGKTTKLNSLLSTHKTEFVLDGAVSAEQIEVIQMSAHKADSFCIVSTQLSEISIPESILSKFEIHRCSMSL